MSASGDKKEERRRAAREALVGNTVAGRYLIRRLVGHGGMGAVYEAEHIGLGKRVAIKFIDQAFATDEHVIARFAREARAMSSIESAHIVTVFDAGTAEGRPYLVMEFLRGEDLGQRLRRTRTVDVTDSLHIIAQVLKGLTKAHAAGIIHRDLKPDNVFLVESDSDPLFAKIVDFGVSKIERPRNKTTPLALTGRGTILGTPFYMSPEQAQAMSDIDVRADIYSVGAILFECLSGRPPHTGETYEQIILSICLRDSPDLRAIDPSIPAPVALFVARSLARDRALRFPSAERMLLALHELAPLERLRVPLEPGVPETLVSALRSGEEGLSSKMALPPREASLGATLLAGSGEPDVEVGAPADRAAKGGASAKRKEAVAQAGRTPRAKRRHVEPIVEEVEPGAAAQAGARRTRRSSVMLAVTALLALFTGIGVMLGVIAMFDDTVEVRKSQSKPKQASTPRNVPAASSNTLTNANTSTNDAQSTDAIRPDAEGIAPAEKAPSPKEIGARDTTSPDPTAREAGDGGR